MYIRSDLYHLLLRYGSDYYLFGLMEFGVSMEELKLAEMKKCTRYGINVYLFGTTSTGTATRRVRPESVRL